MSDNQGQSELQMILDWASENPVLAVLAGAAIVTIIGFIFGVK